MGNNLFGSWEAAAARGRAAPYCTVGLFCVRPTGSWLHDGRDVLRMVTEPGGDRQSDPAASVPSATHRSVRLLAELHRRWVRAHVIM